MNNQLRGIPVTNCDQRLKLFLYSESGCGKSYFCTQFPKAYYIDCEGRIKRQLYVDHLNKNGSAVWQTDNFNELMQEIKTLGSVKHSYQTLVIDSITPVYTKLVDDIHVALLKTGRRLKISEEYQEANKKFKKLTDFLRVLDMNVIVTAHSKDKWDNDDNKLKETTFDAYKKFDYYFEVIMEAKLERDFKKNITDYKAIIKKSTIVTLPPNHKIDFSYENFKRLYEKELQDFTSMPVIEAERTVLQSSSTVQAMSNETKVCEATMKHLSFLMKRNCIEQPIIDKWLKKAGVDSLDKLSELQVIACVKKIESEDSTARRAWVLEQRKERVCKDAVAAYPNGRWGSFEESALMGSHG